MSFTVRGYLFLYTKKGLIHAQTYVLLPYFYTILDSDQLQEYTKSVEDFLFWSCGEPTHREYYLLVWKYNGPRSESTDSSGKVSTESHQDLAH